MITACVQVGDTTRMMTHAWNRKAWVPDGITSGSAWDHVGILQGSQWDHVGFSRITCDLRAKNAVLCMGSHATSDTFYNIKTSYVGLGVTNRCSRRLCGALPVTASLLYHRF